MPDDLAREIRVQAAREGRKLKDLVAELLRAGLALRARGTHAPQRPTLPIIVCRHPPSPEEEMTPDRVFKVLIAHEISDAGKG